MSVVGCNLFVFALLPVEAYRHHYKTSSVHDVLGDKTPNPAHAFYEHLHVTRCVSSSSFLFARYVYVFRVFEVMVIGRTKIPDKKIKQRNRQRLGGDLQNRNLWRTHIGATTLNQLGMFIRKEHDILVRVPITVAVSQTKLSRRLRKSRLSSIGKT